MHLPFACFEYEAESVRTFAEPITARLPAVRLHEVAHLMVQGLITAESPIITQIARGTPHEAESIRPTSKRFYRFLANARFSHTRRARIGFGWLHIRLPETHQELWVVVAHDFEREYDLVLLTNVPLTDAATVRQVYSD